MIVRRIGLADLCLFEHVADDVFDDVIAPDRLAEFVAAPGHLMVVAIDDGMVVGQARGMIHLNPDEPSQLYIDNLGVAPNVQRRGCGRALVQALMAWGAELGAAGAWVATEEDNAPAEALYEALGAKPVSMVYFEYQGLDRP